jgi:ABC-type multidrug transport system fused ATPase/permease subunit
VLHGTARDNIRFYREWLTDEAIERAARLAHIHDDITSWPDGYETLIGQRADGVSGGQRQRLCLARCLAGLPDLLILDEPTSSIDAQSERLILTSLEALRGSLTLILVAHRLTMLDLCDRVMVIRAGRVEAFGPASSLYASNEYYRGAVDLATSGRVAG